MPFKKQLTNRASITIRTCMNLALEVYLFPIRVGAGGDVDCRLVPSFYRLTNTWHIRDNNFIVVG